MKLKFSVILLFLSVSSISFAQVQIDKTLQMTGTFPDNQIVGAGSLGIGTITPAQKIDVVGGDINVATGFGYRVNNTGTSGQYLRGDGTRFAPSAIQAADLPSGSGSYIQNQALTDQAANFQISGSGYIKGNVGVGTANPQAKLNVVGNIYLGTGSDEFGVSAYTIKVLSGSSAINSGNGRDLLVEAGISDNSAGKRGGHLYLRGGQPTAPATQYGNVILADQGGNAGVGNTSPLAKLDVAGTNSDVAGNHHLRMGFNFGYRIDATTGQNLILEWNNSGVWGTGITLSRGTGNVGIGTIGAQDRLHVENGNIRVVNGTARIDLYSAPGLHRGIFGWTGGGIVLYNRDNSPLTFGTTDIERMRIDAVGNVGIATTAPQTRLDLGTAATNKPLIHYSPGSTTTVDYTGFAHNDFLMGSYLSGGYPQNYISVGYRQDPNRMFFFGSASDATFNASTTFVPSLSINSGGVVDLNNGGSFEFHTSTSNNERGYIQAVEAGVNGGAGPGAGLIIATSGGENIAFKQGGLSGTTIMTLTSAGRVGIGTINPSGQLELSINDARKPGSNVWTIVSDARLKNIDGVYEKGLNEILQLNPITYHYKNTGSRQFPEVVLNSEFAGFSAQEVQKIFPECVGVDEDGYLNFNMHAMLVAYVNAFKQQQEQIDLLKKENADLNASVKTLDELSRRVAEIDQLKAEIENLKSFLQQQVQK